MKSLSSTIRKIPLLYLVPAACLFSISCTKSTNNNSLNTSNGQAYLSVTNASPGTSAYDIYADSTKLTTNGQLGYPNTTGVAGSPYETITAGMHSIRLSVNGTTNPIDSSFGFTANQYYSIFAFDTVNS